MVESPLLREVVDKAPSLESPSCPKLPLRLPLKVELCCVNQVYLSAGHTSVLVKHPEKSASPCTNIVPPTIPYIHHHPKSLGVCLKSHLTNLIYLTFESKHVNYIAMREI